MKKNKKLNEDTLLNTEFKNEYYTPEDEFPAIHITSLDQYKELTINKVKCFKMFYSDKIMEECKDWFCDYILDKHKKNKKLNEDTLLNTEFKNKYYNPEDEFPEIHITSLDQYKELRINNVKCCKIFYSDKIIRECYDWFCDYILDKGKKNKKVNEESKIDESVEDTLEAEFEELYKDEIDDEEYDYEDDYVDWIDLLTAEQVNEIYEKYIKGDDEPTILIESLEQYIDMAKSKVNYHHKFVSDEIMQECDDWWFFNYILNKHKKRLNK